MSWIEETDLPDVPPIFRAMSLNPDALDAVKRLNEVISFGNSGLSRIQEESIATVVAVANRCRHGAISHAGFLRRHSNNQEMAAQLLQDYSKAELSRPLRRMLDLAVRVTLDPGGLTKEDLLGLREAGLGDAQILSVVLIACLSNFMDRLANTLGVELPPGYQELVDGWLAGARGPENWLATPTKETSFRSQPEKAPAVTAAERSNEVVSGDPGGNTFAELRTKLESTVESLESTLESTEDTSVEIPVDGVPQGQPPSNHPGEPPPLDESPVEAQGRSHKDLIDPVDPRDDPAAESRGNNAPQTEPPLSRFINDCCRVSPGETATARDLYIAYLRWCDDNDEQPLRQRDFGMKLSQSGYRRQRRSRGRHWWTGIGLPEQVGHPTDNPAAESYDGGTESTSID
ncbi:MAG: peroxidase-related enzyme [Chloroflexi bacterium]|nr:peroxidase-related enzyme [Chloroflexota bacterium]